MYLRDKLSSVILKAFSMILNPKGHSIVSYHEGHRTKYAQR